MAFIEYPKSLYMGGDCAAEHVIVKDREEEDARRAEGFLTFAEKYEADQAATEPADEGDGEETVESLRAKLDALGIKYHHLAGVGKLRSLLPKE